jgi:hypothetical protein
LWKRAHQARLSAVGGFTLHNVMQILYVIFQIKSLAFKMLAAS